MPLPLRIVAWVVAVVLGAYIVRWLAKTIGWLTGDSLIDVITGSGIGRYFRVFALVPFWALATALLATLFIEGGRAWSRRHSVTPNRSGKPPMRKVPPAKAPGAKQPAGAKAHAPKQPKPRPRQPAPRPAAANPPPADPALCTGTQPRGI